jgi:hypothetical protein
LAKPEALGEWLSMSWYLAARAEYYVVLREKRRGKTAFMQSLRIEGTNGCSGLILIGSMDRFVFSVVRLQRKMESLFPVELLLAGYYLGIGRRL